LFGTLLQEVIMAPFNARAFEYYGCLDKVKRFVEDNLEEQITLHQAASVACLAPSYFSRFFHSKVGVTFSGWLSLTRIEKAKTLIEAHDVSITEVAYAVGFRDLRTFERAFSRGLGGVTPREFKKASKLSQGLIDNTNPGKTSTRKSKGMPKDS